MSYTIVKKQKVQEWILGLDHRVQIDDGPKPNGGKKLTYGVDQVWKLNHQYDMA